MFLNLIFSGADAGPYRWKDFVLEQEVVAD